MNWKDASEFIPKESGAYHIKKHHGKAVYYWLSPDCGNIPAWVTEWPRITALEKDWLICPLCHNFEWLDEEEE